MTGTVHVDPGTAELRISGDGEREIDPEDTVPEALTAFLKREWVDQRGVDTAV